MLKDSGHFNAHTTTQGGREEAGEKTTHSGYRWVRFFHSSFFSSLCFLQPRSRRKRQMTFGTVTTNTKARSPSSFFLFGRRNGRLKETRERLFFSAGAKGEERAKKKRAHGSRKKHSWFSFAALNLSSFIELDRCKKKALKSTCWRSNERPRKAVKMSINADAHIDRGAISRGVDESARA